MIKFKEYIAEKVTRDQIKDIEKFADKLFAKVNVDIDLRSKHFYDRLNDPRNGKEISSAEIIRIFKNLFKKHGKKIGGMDPDLQGVVTELNSNNNIPFLIKYDSKNDEIDFIAKTFMKKKNFKPSASDKHLKV